MQAAFGLHTLELNGYIAFCVTNVWIFLYAYFVIFKVQIDDDKNISYFKHLSKLQVKNKLKF